MEKYHMFVVKYGQDHPEVTGKEARAKYEEYKDFYATYHRDNPGVTTDCYAEFLKIHSKQDKRTIEADISLFQQNEVELAFNLSYIDAENVIGDFKHELHAKHRYWTEYRTKYVLYWTLFQDSGYGKSCLIKEVAKDIPTLYLCLCPVASTGYPSQTEIIANFLEKTFFVHLQQGEEWRLAYILFQLMNLFYTKSKSHSPEHMWDLQMGLWDPSFWTEVLKNIENWKQVTENDVLEIMSQNLSWQSYGQEDVKMIICINEARSLLPPRKDAINPFRLFRRALRQISRQGKWTRFFVLFLDTLSKVVNFALPTTADPSTRNDNANVDQETGMILFTPFIKLFTMDIFQQSEIPLDITNSEDREMFTLTRLGRPLGYSYLESNKKNPRRLRNLIEHFKIKLLGGVYDLTHA
ncbi:2192_t:CDS:2 [Funneliformis caledonium]|uniref:2192_t:CDS:1 n=1 Tax=Funneliformis caledonium TaxID=1117310 RepID=A0A9N8ZZH4_9GLOM|nr:2192_t:CDS:2 [Funneliformis caledonium]